MARLACGRTGYFDPVRTDSPSGGVGGRSHRGKPDQRIKTFLRQSQPASDDLKKCPGSPAPADFKSTRTHCGGSRCRHIFIPAAFFSAVGLAKAGGRLLAAATPHQDAAKRNPPFSPARRLVDAASLFPFWIRTLDG